MLGEAINPVFDGYRRIVNMGLAVKHHRRNVSHNHSPA